VRLRKALGEWDEALERYPAPPGAPGTAEWSALIADHAEVRERIAALVEVERQVLELYYYGELNLREISELLNINLSTLKYRFYQAHRRLRETWESAQPLPSAARTKKGARR
jgi:DNA-directed RNA polymerase specialized sigma24 family protein